MRGVCGRKEALWAEKTRSSGRARRITAHKSAAESKRKMRIDFGPRAVICALNLAPLAVRVGGKGGRGKGGCVKMDIMKAKWHLGGGCVQRKCYCERELLSGLLRPSGQSGGGEAAAKDIVACFLLLSS